MTGSDDATTIAELRRLGRSRLSGEDGAREAEILLAAATGRSAAWLRAHAEDVADGDWSARYVDWLQRRTQGEPIAYLIGHREFWSLPLRVTPDVLIPRPDTERLVEMALERLPMGRVARCADLGTGSGAIALAIARERPQAQILATDASPAALAVARENAERLGLQGHIRFRLGDWYSAFTGEPRYQVIVSNPPYISAGDRHLREGDLRFEPKQALMGGRDGLESLRVLIAGAHRHLTPHGWLLLEHGFQQAADVRALMHSAGLMDVDSGRDLTGHERVSCGRMPN